jgi:galactokinase
VSVASEAADAFTRRFGVPPAGVWSAPGRVNLIGEHTDYNDGFVLPFAIPRRIAVAASRHDSPQWSVWSADRPEPAGFTVDDLAPRRDETWGAYVAGVVWALREAGHEPPPARMVIVSDLPVGAGLSSSAALECAVLAALVDLGGLDLPRGEWPKLAQYAENAYVGMPCGVMDQTAATLCRGGHALFLDCRSGAVEHIPFDLAGQGLAMLVVDTNAPHRLVSGEYAARRGSCEEAARTLGLPALRDLSLDRLPDALHRLDEVTGRRVRHVVTENERVLTTVAALRAGPLSPGALATVGAALTASHRSMRDDYEITVPEVDTAVESAVAAGAYGARMTGGGFGGCVLALVAADNLEPVATTVRKAFADAGFKAPDSFPATPDNGVARDF